MPWNWVLAEAVHLQRVDAGLNSRVRLPGGNKGAIALTRLIAGRPLAFLGQGDLVKHRLKLGLVGGAVEALVKATGLERGEVLLRFLDDAYRDLVVCLLFHDLMVR